MSLCPTVLVNNYKLQTAHGISYTRKNAPFDTYERHGKETWKHPVEYGTPRWFGRRQYWWLGADNNGIPIANT